MTDDSGTFAQVARRDAEQGETVRANRSWWDGEAAEYYAEHGAFLGDEDFVWGPEGLREADARLLGDLDGRRVLESVPARASAPGGRPPAARRSWPPTCPPGCCARGSGSTTG